MAAEIPILLKRIQEAADRAEPDPDALEGSLMLGLNFAKLLYDAFMSDRPVAWINVFTPQELVYGCGCTPFLLEATGGFSSWVEMDEVLSGADTLLHSRDACTFLRAAVGGLTMGLWPTPKIVMCTSHLCEGAPKVAHIAADYSGVEFKLIDVPAGLSETAVKYLARQLETLAHELCRLKGEKFDIDRLREAVAYSEQARQSFYDIEEMRKVKPAPVLGSQFVGIGLFFPWGTEEGADIARSMRDEIAARVADNFAAVEGGEKHRLLWIHLRPYFETDIMEYLERDLRAVIVMHTLGNVWRSEYDDKDPFRTLAIRVLSNPNLASTGEKIKWILKLADEYSVNGVVDFLHWGCRWNYGESNALRKAASEAGLPFLLLDGDCVDKRATPHGQLLTRLEGFVEMLESSGRRAHATRLP